MVGVQNLESWVPILIPPLSLILALKRTYDRHFQNMNRGNQVRETV